MLVSTLSRVGFFFFSSRRRHTRFKCDWSSDVCSSDLDWPVKPNPPFIPGHEGVGYVAAVGAGVTHVKEGDRVGIPWLYTACGHCEHCLGGWETLCEQQKNTGYSVNGGFAQYALAHAHFLGPLPRSRDPNDI